MSVITEELIQYIHQSHYEKLPSHVVHEARRSLMNYFAVCIASYQDPTMLKAYRILSQFSGKAQASVIGFENKLDILQACAMNAMAANVFDFDDTHIPTIIHPTAPVAAPLFAISQQKIISGKEFLSALVMGMEVECRIGNAISPFHYNKGWHITSTCGVFGAAIGSAKLMGLNQKQILWALGNAATQACGLVENLGTMSKSLSVGNAAKNGLLSAICALENFDGPQNPLEGTRGFLKVFGDQVHVEHLNEKLGSHWEVLKNTYKPYPCGVVLNPVIEACLEIYEQEQSNPDFLSSIQEIRIMGNPLLKQRTDRPSIENGRQSQVSGQHAVAVVLHFGQASLKEFSDEIVNNEKIQAFYSKVSFTDDTAIAVDGVKIQLICNDRMIEKQIEHAKGSVSRPLSDEDLENKLKDQITHHQLKLDAEKIIKLIWSIDYLPDVGLIFQALDFNQS
jgi:2-methylcitrate dehydratase PrpD